jgi:hypothetical protein
MAVPGALTGEGMRRFTWKAALDNWININQKSRPRRDGSPTRVLIGVSLVG